MAKAAGLTGQPGMGMVGMVAPGVVQVAALESVDQIVLGTHGRGAVGNLFLGSVAQRVVHMAPVPVLLVK